MEEHAVCTQPSRGGGEGNGLRAKISNFLLHCCLYTPTLCYSYPSSSQKNVLRNKQLRAIRALYEKPLVIKPESSIHALPDSSHNVVNLSTLLVLDLSAVLVATT